MVGVILIVRKLFTVMFKVFKPKRPLNSPIKLTSSVSAFYQTDVRNGCNWSMTYRTIPDSTPLFEINFSTNYNIQIFG